MTIFTLTILDAPTGKGRPRFDGRSGRAYSPSKTRHVEAFIRDSWHLAGEPSLPGDTPLTATLVCVLKRPAGHYRKGGELSAEGLRQPAPCRQKPDADNAAKLILDALEGYAYPRDVAITTLVVTKRWAEDAEPSCTYVTVEVQAT